MVSGEQTACPYELWLTCPGERTRLLNEYGLYESEPDALRVASALSEWICLGLWLGEVLDRLPADVQDDAWHTRQALKGGNLAGLRIKVRESRVRQTEYGRALAVAMDDGADDTDLDDPDVLYLGVDGE